jgi:hypothetical protein
LVFFTFLSFFSFFTSAGFSAGASTFAAGVAGVAGVAFLSCANPVNAKERPITTAKNNTNTFFILFHLLQFLLKS